MQSADLPDSVTLWISHLKAGDAAAADQLWQRLRELLAVELEHRIANSQSLDEHDLRRRFPDDGEVLDLALNEARMDLSPTHVVDLGAQPTVGGGVPGFLCDHPRYRVSHRLATGGMGDVWLAEHAVLGRQVAIKVIRSDLLKNSDARSRFLREAQTAARLNHPNVVTIHDAEASGSSPFLVMEYLKGADLAQLVRDQGPLTSELACDVIRQAAQGLAAAHAAGLVHRDLSPRNLLRTPDGTVKLLDFGLAAVSSDARLMLEDEAGSLIGSADFMAPEQARNPAASDVRSDLYSLGCVLFYLLSGQPPFARGTLAERLKAHANAPIPDLAALRPGLPPGLLDLVSRLLAKSPAERPQSPDELIRLLEPFASVRGDSRKAPASENRPWWNRSAGILVTTVLLAAVGLGLVLRPWERTGPPRVRPNAVQLALQESQLLLAQRQESQMRTALARLDRLIEQNPDCAACYSQLAEAWNLLGDYGWDDADDCFPRAISAAKEALRLDPDSASAHLALAFAWHSYDCDWDQAEREYLRSIELDDQQPAAHHWYAWLLVQRGRFDAARAEILLAHELSPLDLIVMNNVGTIEYYSRNYAEAARWHREALVLGPDFRKAHFDLGHALIELGDFEAAIDQLEKAAGLANGNEGIQAARAYALARAGDQATARQLAAELEPAMKSQRMALELARIHAALGEVDQAINCLELAFELRSPGRAGLGVDPRWDPLRHDPRFQQLERRLFEK